MQHYHSRGVIPEAQIAQRVRSRILAMGMTAAMRQSHLSHFALANVAARLPSRFATVEAVTRWLDS